MTRIILWAGIALAASASTAAAFGPATVAAQPGRTMMGPMDRPAVCLPDRKSGCDRLALNRGDSNESEQRIARLSENDRRIAATQQRSQQAAR